MFSNKNDQRMRYARVGKNLIAVFSKYESAYNVMHTLFKAIQISFFRHYIKCSAFFCFQNV